MTFTAGEMSAILMVSTMDDNTVELSEYFVVMIESTDRSPLVEIGSPNVAFIAIEDPCTYMHILYVQMMYYIILRFTYFKDGVQ